MKFGNLQAIHFIWLMAAIVLFFLWSYRKRKRDMELFAHRDLLDDLTGSLDRKRQKLKGYFIMVSLVLIIFSLMRPQWGFEWKEVTRSGLDILIALDTSKSMLAEDVKPNRLERSKLAVRDLMKKLQGDRIGLIAFAGNAFLQCPLTVDYSGFALSLEDLDVNTIPKGGTSLSDAVRVAIGSYEGGKKKFKVLVIITDGEDHEGSAMEWAETAKEKGIKIFAIGIGTKEGELIPITDESGGVSFLKDRKGNVVKTRLDEASLQNMALTTGGSYVKATNKEFGLDLIYKEKLSQMEKREIKNKMVKRYEERFQISLVLALILLCIEPFITEKKKTVVSSQKSVIRGKKTKILLLLLCCLSIILLNTVAYTQTEETGKNLEEALSVEQASEKDLEKYEKAVEDDPDSDIANYNLGTAYYRKGQYEKSIESFIKSLNTEDREIEAKAIYNMANSKYRMGSLQADKDLNIAIEHYKESLDYYRRAMELDESDRDAKYNHELVEKKLKILLDKMKNQQQQDQNKDQDKNSDKENQEGQNKEGQQQKEDEEQQSSDKEQSGEEKENGADQEQGEQEMESAGKEDGSSEQMSPEEARMLLEAYGQDEAREEVNQKLRGRHGEVLKDW